MTIIKSPHKKIKRCNFEEEEKPPEPFTIPTNVFATRAPKPYDDYWRDLKSEDIDAEAAAARGAKMAIDYRNGGASNDEPEGEKQCYQCKETKLMRKFAPSKNTQDGHLSICKACQYLNRFGYPRPKRLEDKD